MQVLGGLVLCLYVALNPLSSAVVSSLAVQLECDALRILVQVHPDPEVVDTLQQSLLALLEITFAFLDVVEDGGPGGRRLDCS
jgi:hypothetical protein